MTAVELIVSSLLLGGFVAAGGAYGILLSLGHALRDARWRRLALAAYAVQCIFAVAVVVFTPLDWWWKLLIGASDAAYYFVPPMTWRYLISLHDLPEESSR
ncbi:MAG TPA: hypothetical protein VFN37_11230 [Candidatus Baltobacteraceae bacterium]|nr:hypothetical protein [Candidatus Baltobacteraceae bacterium]